MYEKQKTTENQKNPTAENQRTVQKRSNSVICKKCHVLTRSLVYFAYVTQKKRNEYNKTKYQYCQFCDIIYSAAEFKIDIDTLPAQVGWHNTPTAQRTAKNQYVDWMANTKKAEAAEIEKQRAEAYFGQY